MNMKANTAGRTLTAALSCVLLTSMAFSLAGCSKSDEDTNNYMSIEQTEKHYLSVAIDKASKLHEELKNSRDAAKGTLDSSAGKTNDGNVARTDLSAAIQKADELLKIDVKMLDYISLWKHREEVLGSISSLNGRKAAVEGQVKSWQDAVAKETENDGSDDAANDAEQQKLNDEIRRQQQEQQQREQARQDADSSRKQWRESMKAKSVATVELSSADIFTYPNPKVLAAKKTVQEVKPGDIITIHLDGNDYFYKVENVQKSASGETPVLSVPSDGSNRFIIVSAKSTDGGQSTSSSVDQSIILLQGVKQS